MVDLVSMVLVNGGWNPRVMSCPMFRAFWTKSNQIRTLSLRPEGTRFGLDPDMRRWSLFSVSGNPCKRKRSTQHIPEWAHIGFSGQWLSWRRLGNIFLSLPESHKSQTLTDGRTCQRPGKHRPYANANTHIYPHWNLVLNSAGLLSFEEFANVNSNHPLWGCMMHN